MDNPRRGNSLDATLVESLLACFHHAISSPNVCVIILTATGKYFCTGLDLSTAVVSTSSSTNNINYKDSVRLFDTLYECPKPLITVLNGPALGGGVGLFFTGDIRLSHADAYIQLTEVKRGLAPVLISKYIIPEVGRATASEWILCAKRVGARELKERNGVVHAIGSTIEELEEKTMAYVKLMKEGGPKALRDSKRLIKRLSGREDKETERMLAEVFERMMRSEEAAHGIAAFMSKKKPEWAKL